MLLHERFWVDLELSWLGTHSPGAKSFEIVAVYLNSKKYRYIGW